jgi:hypothetical protein
MARQNHKIEIRTQIYLTRNEHIFLRREAEQKRTSIAAVIRGLIDEKMPSQQDFEDNPLFSIGEDNFRMSRERGASDHDEYIYRGR